MARNDGAARASLLGVLANHALLLVVLVVILARPGSSATGQSDGGNVPNTGDKSSKLEVDVNGVLTDHFKWPGGKEEHEIFDGKPRSGFWKSEEASQEPEQGPRAISKWTTKSRFSALRYEINISTMQTNYQGYRDSTEKYMGRIKAEADRRACFGWVQSVDIDGHRFPIGCESRGRDHGTLWHPCVNSPALGRIRIAAIAPLPP